MTSDLPSLIDTVKALDATASAGPWEATDNHVYIPTVGAVEFVTDNPMAGDSSNDTHLIAYYRTAAPRLAREVERLTQENTRLRARLQEAEHLMTQVALIVENAYLAHKPDSKYDLAVSLLRQFLAAHETL